MLFSRLLKVGLIILKILIWYPNDAECAGVTSHLTFLARVAPEELHDYYPWLKAGAFFPDSLYSCKPGKKLSDFAEVTHWPPFMIDSIKYWHKTYGSDSERRYCQDSIKLQAFLLGIFTHQVVDSSWHSLVKGYRSHGLLRVLSEIEFEGHIDEAHDFIDVMGEFIGLSNVIRNSQSTAWMFYTNANWSLPREDDIMEMLHRNGLTSEDISFAELDICAKRGLSASISELYTFSKRRAQLLNVAYGISPRARDFMQECWLGGEFDLIAMLQKCLPAVQNLFDQDISSQDMLSQLELCGNLPSISNSISSGVVRIERSKDTKFVTPTVSLSSFGTCLELGQFKADGLVYLAVGAPMENSRGSVYLIPLDEFKTQTLHPHTLEPFTSMRGAKVNKFSLNCIDYLVISEPGSNSLLFYHNDELLLTIEDGLTAGALQLRVSSIQDVDGDGIPEILLAGESYGVNETGSVTVIFGASIAPFLGVENSHKTIDISSVSTIRLHGGPFSVPYQHFGANVVVSSMWNKKGFLFVTCQNLGAIFAYGLNELQNNVLPKYVIIEKSIILPSEDVPINFEKVSSKTHGMFGKTLYTLTYNGENFVVVSQHLFSKVFLYKEGDGFLEYFITLSLIVESEPVFYSVGFGTAIEYSSEDEAIFISSPGSYEGKGAIWKISMKEIYETVNFWKLDVLLVNTLKHLHMVNPLVDDKGVTNFGHSLKASVEGHLIIGVPQYGYGSLEGHQLTGAIVLS